MPSINSVKKGDQFEMKVFQILKQLLENDELFLPGKRSKIFQRKKYYSKIREDDIEFDIAIETYINDSDKYSLLTVIECKDYSKTVPVNDIEEFAHKLSGVGTHNIKG